MYKKTDLQLLTNMRATNLEFIPKDSKFVAEKFHRINNRSMSGRLAADERVCESRHGEIPLSKYVRRSRR